jgi:hypothetical protein
MRCRVLVWTVALAFLPARLPSQDSLPPQSLRIKAGQRVRLRTVDGRLLDGPVARLTPTSGLQLTAPDSIIPLAAIDSLWLRRTKAGTGAWIGAVALGIPSAIYWSWLCTAVAEGTGCDVWGVVAGLTLAGAAVGAGVGALIGSGSVRWELRYARPPGSAFRQPRAERQLRLGVRLRIP